MFKLHYGVYKDNHGQPCSFLIFVSDSGKISDLNKLIL